MASIYQLIGLTEKKSKSRKTRELKKKAKHDKNYFPILWTIQSCWQRGHLLFCWTHKDIQQLWKEWLHSPQTTTQSSCLLSAWHLRQASITWTRHMAQVSHSQSHDHIAHAFHFFITNNLSLFRCSSFPSFTPSINSLSTTSSSSAISLVYIFISNSIKT
jgi:hypothetical protein